MQAEVSVIIPFYNRQQYLLPAIDSVLQQTFSNFELLLVNDGSSDDSGLLIDQINDPRIRQINHSVNQGAAAARNTGIQHAQGEFIAFLDSDDEWAANKLAIQLPALKQAMPNCKVSCSWHYLHLVDQHRTQTKKLQTPEHWQQHLCQHCDFSPGSTLLAHRSVFTEVGLLDTNLPRFEDWDWLLRYAATGDIYICAELITTVHTISHGKADIVAQAGQQFIGKHGPLWYQFGQQFYQACVANIWLIVLFNYLAERRWSKAAYYYQKALFQCPAAILRRSLQYIIKRFKRS